MNNIFTSQLQSPYGYHSDECELRILQHVLHGELWVSERVIFPSYNLRWLWASTNPIINTIYANSFLALTNPVVIIIFTE